MNQVTGSLEMVALKFPQGRGKVLAGKWNELEPEPVRPAPQPASAEELPAQEDSEYFAESRFLNRCVGRSARIALRSRHLRSKINLRNGRKR